ncbi:MAG: Cys-tRNA(Pro) deacylase, partial [Bacteroidales bacterium]|nr:Cys-tRNA(Pro) deacylase [Bacteroidales bacterium]
IRGGCSPIGMKKKYPTYIHSTALGFDSIFISAGVRGLQLQLSPSELISFTNATVGDFAE